MTRTVPALALAALVLAAPAAAQEAPFRVGYVQTDSVLLRMPELPGLQGELAAERQRIGQAVRARQDSLAGLFQQRAAEFRSLQGNALVTDSVRARRQGELVQLQDAVEAQIQRTELAGLGALERRQNELFEPLLVRIDGAISAVAAAQGVDMVVPPQSPQGAPTFLYAGPRVRDLTDDVLRQLGIDPSTPPLEIQRDQLGAAGN